MKVDIDVDIPEGWVPVRYGVPAVDENYLGADGRVCLYNGIPGTFVILEREKPAVLVNWDHIDIGFDYLAIDGDGDILLSYEEPHLEDPMDTLWKMNYNTSVTIGKVGYCCVLSSFEFHGEYGKPYLISRPSKGEEK
tara:strand:+ start:129 stop:539 length:411 start_codon:yes stop_codon:yes gene_type:complete